MNPLAEWSWLPIGLIVGAVAWIVLPVRRPMTMITTLLLGLLGAFLGVFFSGIVFADAEAPFRPVSILLEILGALVVLGVYLTIKLPKKRTKTGR